jgi:RimJ/RimL family protein N-acetyltransferase
MNETAPSASAADDTVFTTARIIVRRWRHSDLDALVEVYGDADAMRWVGDGRAITRDECVRWLDVTANNYAKRGYGMFALEAHDAPGAVFGFAGLVHPGGQEAAEVKYALRRSHWGRGLATEAVIGLLAYGASAHGLRVVIATTAPANEASHRVLLKAGLQRGPLRRNDDGSDTQLFHWHAA